MRIPFALFLHFCAICGGGVFAQKIREFVAPPPIRNVTVKATAKNDERGGAFDDPRKVSEGTNTGNNGTMPATNTVTSSISNTTKPSIKKTVIRNDTVVSSTTSKTTVVTTVTIMPTKRKGTQEVEGAGELVIPLNQNTERTEANEGRNVGGGGENVHKTPSSGRTKLETTTEKGRKEEGKKERKVEEKKGEKEAKGGGKREERKEEKKEERKVEEKKGEKEAKGGGKREERKEEKKEEDKIGEKEEKKEEKGEMKVEEKKGEKEAKRGGKGEERKVEEKKEEKEVKGGGKREERKEEKKEKEEERMEEKRKETEENVSTTVATSVVGMTGGGLSTTIVSETDQNGGGGETEGEGEEEETKISENGDELSMSSTTPKSVVVVSSIELPSPTNEHCTDTHEYCRFWARNGFCTNTFYTREQIAQFCRKTCAMC
uniref:ShKT domain-containing protein n=1 Tax=Globodera rostochiensis TaxID=31243 RepID=A0A914H5N6_GLORO